MVVPSSGTLTFLYTDIEGSTILAQQHPEAISPLLSRHNAILYEAITTNNGQVFRIIGDAFCAAFHTAEEALNAALAAQRILQHETWMPVGITVRMGIHTGVASLDDINASAGGSGYLTLTRAQRIMSAAHGGQVLLSSTSAELARGQLPPGVTLRDLGQHRLKGLEQPEHLWQVIAPDLVSEFPPIQSLSTIPGNLPVQVSSFIGRDHEIGEIKQLLNGTHLITLTGPGGTGKTRLSLQVATDVLEQFADGAWFVELAPLAEPSLVPQTIATALALREQPGRPVLAQLKDYLRSKKLLLVLDNCEHLIAACANLADALLHTCPDLHIIASSREALGITGETSYLVPPLQTPKGNGHTTPEQLLQYESVRLFVARAHNAQPHFVLNEANAQAVAQICRRLDGIPLAIELAAARINVFTPERIAARLDDRFRLLTGGSRTALPRQQTLRALIEWSYDLLSRDECALLRRLSVFAGGWTFEAAEFVCSLGEETPAIDVFETMPQLVNKSLVMAVEQGSETRYHFLETIRQFANDKLQESGETERVRARHLEYFVSLIQQAEPDLRGAEQVKWLDRFDVEEDNIRAAIDWALKNGRVDKALDLIGSIWWFWYTRDHFSEADDRMRAALALSAVTDSTESRLKVMIGLGFIQYAAGSLEEARAVLVEAVRQSQELGARRILAEALQFLGATEIEIAISTTRQFEHVRNIMQRCLELWQALGDKTGISWELNLMANLARLEGDLPQARSLLEQSVAMRRVIGDRILLAYSLRRLGDIAVAQGDFESAEAYYREAHLMAFETGGKAGIAASLAGFAGLALAQGQVIRSVRLFGAADTILRSLSWRLPPADNEMYERNLARAREQLRKDAFEAAWMEGCVFGMDQAIAYALADAEAP